MKTHHAALVVVPPLAALLKRYKERNLSRHDK